MILLSGSQALIGWFLLVWRRLIKMEWQNKKARVWIKAPVGSVNLTYTGKILEKSDSKIVFLDKFGIVCEWPVDRVLEIKEISTEKTEKKGRSRGYD